MPADIPVAWEYSSYLMAACFTFGAAMTLRAGGHIRVTLVLGRLAPPARRLLEIAASLVATLFVGFLAIAMARFAWTRVRARARPRSPAARCSGFPKAVIAFGMVLLALQFLARFIQARARPAAGRSPHQGGAGRIAMGAITGTMFAILFSALAGGIWIGLTLGATGAVLLAIFRNIPLDKLLAQYAWNILTTQELLALPMFILMGEILFQSRLSRSLFQGLAPWAGLLPGRLLHVNVVGCSIFAAISGSSAATTQVVGRIALAELTKRGYSKDIAIGSLAGAGTLGFLIPPSNIMIIYGVLGDVSILKLFTAGFIPGFLLAGCFMAWVMIHTTLRPGLVPEAERALQPHPDASIASRR